MSSDSETSESPDLMKEYGQIATRGAIAVKEGVLKNLLSQAGMNTDDDEAVRRFFNDKHVRLVTYISDIGVEYLMMGNTILGTFSWNLLMDE